MRSPARAPRLIVLAIAGALLCGAAASAAQTSPAKSFVWKVNAKGKVLYLAGSVHALTADSYPLSAAFENAFESSGTLVEEIDLDEALSTAAAPALLAKGIYLDGRRFDQAVSKETADLVSARIASAGLPAEMMQRMKPWMVMLTIAAIETQKAGFDPALGLDKHFYDRARSAGKPVVGLETAESQIDRLDQMPNTLQEQMLRSTFEELDTQRESLTTIVKAWQQGDAAAIEKTLLGAFVEYPAAYRSLIVERNQNWMPQIDACLTRPQPCFVVVGAAHLVGKDGLLAMLQARGYQIEQQ